LNIRILKEQTEEIERIFKEQIEEIKKKIANVSQAFQNSRDMPNKVKVEGDI
jgi:hypothetical protein